MEKTAHRGLGSLPPELLLAIAEQLPVDSRLVFSGTCSSFHNIIQSNRLTRCSGRDLDFVTLVDYLTAIARDLPDMWVCEICLALHPVDRQDTPQSPFATTCFRKPGNAVIGRKLCWPHHRHVQIALKYTRLGVQDPDRRRHLIELLDPVFGNHPPDPQDSWIARVTYASRAKIVNGRYLLKYTWHYNATSEPIESLCRGHNARLLICNHRGVSGYVMAKIFQRIEQPGEQETARTSAQSPRPLTEPLAVRTATRENLLDAQRGIELTGSCTRCPTDFSICVGEDCVWFLAWYDLGPEGSPFDEAWARHKIIEPCGTISRSPNAGHVEGSIRRLYQQTAHRDIENEVE